MTELIVGKHERLAVHLTPVAGSFASRLWRGAEAVRLRLGLSWMIVSPSELLRGEQKAACAIEGLPWALRLLPWPLRPVSGVIWVAWRVARTTSKCAPAIVHCHGVSMLGAAALAAWRTGAPLLYDAHELETDAGQSRRQQWFDRWQERLLIRRADAVVVVSDSIADWYMNAYGIPRPVVVRNIPSVSAKAALDQHPRAWRDRFGIADEAVIFLYQGKLAKGRRIEQLLRVFARAGSDRHVVFMGFGELEGLVRAAAAKHVNIHFAEAVSPDQVLAYTAGADVGIHGGENICLSYYYSLPNKFFEYLAAGLGVMVPDWPEVGRIIRDTGAGWVVQGDEDEDWLRAVTALTWDDVRARKKNARRAAPNFSWDAEAERLIGAYQAAFRLERRE
jgi:glycosyltransferase involved in cell wall biosynthesis